MSKRASILGDGVAKAIRLQWRGDIPCMSAAGRSSGLATRSRQPWRFTNTTEEGPRRRLLVRPSDYMLAEKKAAALGGELVGFYHSHPDHPARPSQFELDHAWPNFHYVIVAVAWRAGRRP